MPRSRLFLLLVLAAAILTTSFNPLQGSNAQTQFEVAEPFRDYYARHQGLRVLGYPLARLGQVEPRIPAQYFEKGRIEDQRERIAEPQWAYTFGLLTSQLMERDPNGAVSGTSITYGSLRNAADPRGRVAPPTGFTGGTVAIEGGRFIPYHSNLRPGPGYIVPTYFWNYINNPALFPGGWLHDVGLPLTGVLNATVDKRGERREITMQAFERAVLSYDPKNPAEWRVERANIGADALRTVRPQPGSEQVTIEIPAPGARDILPLNVLARVGQPGEQVIAALRWSDGIELSNAFTLLRGEDGRGILVDSLDWLTEGMPPLPPTQPATLEIRNMAGQILAQQSVTMLRYDDPDAQVVAIHWLIDNNGVPEDQVQQRRVPRTPSVGAAALEELLWGPSGLNLAGFITALPTPKEVIEYPGREPGWGPRVRLLGLTITNGVATANFSKELRAYGGGSTRVLLIREQITRTLKEFPGVQEVRIAIEGQTEGVLEP